MKNEKALSVLKGVPKALARVDERLKALKNFQSITKKTHGNFKWAPHSNYGTDIFQLQSFESLCDIYTYLRTKHEECTADRERLAKEFGVGEYAVWKWQGFTWEAWKHDLKLAIGKLTVDSSKAKLSNLKDKLSQHLSEEDRLAMELAEAGMDDILEDLFPPTEDVDIQVEE